MKTAMAHALRMAAKEIEKMMQNFLVISECSLKCAKYQILFQIKWRKYGSTIIFILVPYICVKLMVADMRQSKCPHFASHYLYLIEVTFPQVVIIPVRLMLQVITNERCYNYYRWFEPTLRFKAPLPFPTFYQSVDAFHPFDSETFSLIHGSFFCKLLID